MESKAEKAYFAELRVKELAILNPCFFLGLKVSIVESDIFSTPTQPSPLRGGGRGWGGLIVNVFKSFAIVEASERD